MDSLFYLLRCCKSKDLYQHTLEYLVGHSLECHRFGNRIMSNKTEDDPTLVLKKHGGWALGKTAPLLTKKADKGQEKDVVTLKSNC